MGAELALGTYRCKNVSEAAEAAVAAGATWIDTAPNYRGGTAEGQLGAVLRGHNDVRVSTKVGFIGAHTADALFARVVTADEASSGYCLRSSYVEWQTARSNWLLRRVPEVVFVHNPEHGEPEPAVLEERLLGAFRALEQGCAEGMLAAYGVATWSCLHDGTLSVKRLLQLASTAGGPDHHLRAIQLPLSLVMIGPLADAARGRGVLVEAEAAGLDVYASAPLNGGELVEIVTPAVAKQLVRGSTPLDLLLGIVAVAPAVRRVLLSTSSRLHWDLAATSMAKPISPADMNLVIDAFAS
jgi:aryl-alcohol dehydrogenase-like predicted oxidoreductase